MDRPPQPHADLFVGDSEMAELMRRHDWAATPLGPPEGWPEALKVALRILLTSRFEMWLGWGPEIAFFYNDAYRPTLGRKHPQALGAPMRAVWSEVWEDVQERVHSVYERGTATWDRALMLMLERSGYPEETYHTFSYSPLLGDTGRVEGLFCAVSEETERVLSERRLAALSTLSAGLAASDSRAKAIEAARGGLEAAARDLPFALIYLFDAEGRAALACATGVAPEHPYARDAARWRASDFLADAAELSFALDADAPTGGLWPAPPRTALALPLGGQGGARPLGVIVAALSRYRPVDAAATDLVRLLAGQIGAGLDNADAYEAERRQLSAEVEVRTAERDRLRHLFGQAPGFMCVLDGPAHRYELLNAAYQQLTGHRDLAGKTIREALPELAGQGFFELLDEVYRSGTPFIGRGMRVLLQREPGAALDERFLNFVYQPILAADGTVAGIFAEGNDVTEQIHAERALQDLNGTLEARIAARTEELAATLDRLRRESTEREAAEEALRQAQKMEAVGQLTGGIAHDFNNLLQGISGSLTLIRRRIEQGRVPEVERFIGDASNAAKRAAALTHRLLAFSRRQPLDPKPVAANPLITAIEDLLQRSLGEQIVLRLALAPDLWPTLCDANQLENALLNLCINARDAMPDGGTLAIATANRTVGPGTAGLAPGDYVCVTVADDGSGMTPEVRARAFDPFFTTKPIGQGTGLGLSMIYGFARQSGGDVRIESEPGRGTTVALFLPRHAGEAAEDAEPPTAPPAPARRDARGETVLVIEDNPIVRAQVVEVLHELGYRTVEAADGPTGLAELLGPRPIDLLVTDIGLPGLNGRQVADAARAERPGLKVLLMTGYAENVTSAAEVLAPGVALIAKPFALDEFAERLGELRS